MDKYFQKYYDKDKRGRIGKCNNENKRRDDKIVRAYVIEFLVSFLVSMLQEQIASERYHCRGRRGSIFERKKGIGVKPR